MATLEQKPLKLYHLVGPLINRSFLKQKTRALICGMDYEISQKNYCTQWEYSPSGITIYLIRIPRICRTKLMPFLIVTIELVFV
jgi:hypothetical protein